MGSFRSIVLSAARVSALLALPCVAVCQSTSEKKAPKVECLLDQGKCAGGVISAGLSDEISLQIDDLAASGTVESTQKTVDPRKFILYLDERPIKGLYPSSVVQVGASTQFLYRLTRTPDSKSTWSPLLASDKKPHMVRVSVGPENAQPFSSSAAASFQLVVLRTGWQMWAFVIVTLLILGSLIFVRNIQQMFREGGPLEEPNTVAAYSLAKCQMGFWFFVVLFSYIFIWLITWDRDVIPTDVLSLLGISAATFLAATAIDVSKSSDALASMAPLAGEITALETQLQGAMAQNPVPQAAISALQLQVATKTEALKRLKGQFYAPVHVGIASDLLSDANGYSFHRFQIVTWTFVLAIVFANSVWGDLSMPVFSSTLLGLMGISNGTYIGFKFPEQKS